MPGVRREGATDAVGKLQRAGLISHSRSHIMVLDRPGLEVPVCECYQVSRRNLIACCPTHMVWLADI
jgi:hypothetical protein